MKKVFLVHVIFEDADPSLHEYVQAWVYSCDDDQADARQAEQQVKDYYAKTPFSVKCVPLIGPRQKTTRKPGNLVGERGDFSVPHLCKDSFPPEAKSPDGELLGYSPDVIIDPKAEKRNWIIGWYDHDYKQWKFRNGEDEQFFDIDLAVWFMPPQPDSE